MAQYLEAYDSFTLTTTRATPKRTTRLGNGTDVTKTSVTVLRAISSLLGPPIVVENAKYGTVALSLKSLDTTNLNGETCWEQNGNKEQENKRVTSGTWRIIVSLLVSRDNRSDRVLKTNAQDDVSPEFFLYDRRSSPCDAIAFWEKRSHIVQRYWWTLHFPPSCKRRYEISSKMIQSRTRAVARLQLTKRRIVVAAFFTEENIVFLSTFLPVVEHQ